MGEIVGGGTPKTDVKNYWNDGDIPWLTPADMKWVKGKYVSSGQRNITVQALQASSAQLMPPGSVIYSSRAPIGYIAIAENDLCTNQGFKSIVLISTSLSDYLYYALIAATPEIQSRASGTTFKEISGTEFGQTLVPLPPLAEQCNIINKIERLLPELETYNTKYNALSVLNGELPSKLKKSILQHAIQGKLVPQDPTDEPASSLLERIAKERAKLGKKAAKSMSRIERRDRGTYEIFPDGTEKDISGEIPFDIPDSWEWCRLVHISSLSGGFAFKSSNFSQEGVRVIRISDFSPEGIKQTSIVRHKPFDNLVDFEINLNDILLCMTGGTVGKSCFIQELSEKMYLNQRVCSIRSKINSNLLYYIVSSFYIQDIIRKEKNSTNDNISLELIKSFLIPVPPLKEQHRIVEKLGVLMEEIGATK